MLEEQPIIVSRLEKICQQLDFSIYRKPKVHAGGKFIWRYRSALGNYGNIEIDLNFMFRIPMLPIRYLDSVSIAGDQVLQFPILDIHELAAGKLSALLDRGAGRDLFDMHLLLNSGLIKEDIFREIFILYSVMSGKIDLRLLKGKGFQINFQDFTNRLLPMLKKENTKNTHAWRDEMISTCQRKLETYFSLTDKEKLFLTELLDNGNIQPELLISENLQKTALTHPAIQWAMFKRNKQPVT